MRLPAVGPCAVVEADDGVEITIDSGRSRMHITLDARESRQLAEQLLFVLDGSVIVATNRLEGF
jgi:hypothetical protein